MPHRIARARWALRREMRHASAWMQRNGVWLIGTMGALDLGLHLYAGVEAHQAVYEVVRTIVLDGEASLWDHAGNPRWLRESMWFMRLALPALAGGALLDVVSRMLPDPLQAPGWMNGHTIVVGAGRLGYRVSLELVRRGEPLVVINLNDEGEGLRQLREQEGVTTLIGDAREGQMLERAGIQRASRVVAVTGSDVVNLSVGLLALDPHVGNEELKTWAHVFDPRLDDIPEHFGQGREGRLGTFSLFRDAAQHFCAGRCADGDWEMAVIAGYGRFGQAMVESLRELRGHTWPIVVLDRKPLPDGAADPHRIHLQGDLLSKRTLKRLEPHLGQVEKVLCVVCTDSDAANLAFALRLREALSEAEVTVFTRLFEWPDTMHSADSLDGIQPLELWDEAGMAVVNRLLDQESS